MSYSMSPPQTFSPSYPGAGSPPNPSPYGQPPTKRQRLSPDPRSPNTGAPNYAVQQQQQPQGLHPPSPYGNPYAPQSAQTPYAPQGFISSPQNSFNTPQAHPYQQATWPSRSGTPTQMQTPASAAVGHTSPTSHQSREMMPPPPRPNRDERDEKVGVEEIGDSLYGSGINLKDEENYMHTMYHNRHPTDSFGTTQTTSFGSSTMSPNNSFNMLTHGTSFNSQEVNGAFAGTISQPRSQEDIELEQRRKRDAAAKARAERRQHHLNNQFLLCNNVRKRMDDVARNNGVTLNTTGMLVRQPGTTVMIGGPGSEAIVAADERVNGVKPEEPPESVVSQGVAFEHVLALISLATGERLRGLMDESYALARARRYGDRGMVVPPEFADIAEGEGKQADEHVVPENLSGTQWDKVEGSSPQDVEMKDGQPTKPATPHPQHTLSFQGTLNASLRELAEREKQAEKERIKKRESRKRTVDAAINGETATTADTPAESPAVSTPAEGAAPVKLTKKEQIKQQKEKNNMESQTHTNTNQTAAMMALGKKGNRYSWMSGGVANLPTNRFAKPSSAGNSGNATPSAVKQEARSPAAGGVAMGRGGSGQGIEPKASDWGDWSEDGAGGKGVQMRDWVLVLERDGREKLALQKALLKMA